MVPLSIFSGNSAQCPHFLALAKLARTMCVK